MIHQRIKNFWINKINGLIATYSLDPNLLTEGAKWDEKLKALQKWSKIGAYGENVFKDVYTKANQPIPNPLFSENYGGLLGAAFSDLEVEFEKKDDRLNQVGQNLRTILGLVPTDDIPTDWNTKLAKKADLDAANQIITKAETYLGLGTKKLEDIMDAGDPDNGLNPASDYLELPNSLENLVYWYLENDKLLDIRAVGLEIFVRNNFGDATAIDLDKVENYAQSLNRLGLTDFSAATITAKLGTNKLSDIPAGKTLTDLLTAGANCPNPAHHVDYDAIKDTLDAYQDGFRQVLELNPTDPLPTDLNNLANLYNAKSGTQTVPELKTKADHYDRIHTKLNGQVSDTELDTLLSNSPSCSHTDYDAIKQERDQLKTDKDNHKCDCDSKVAQKETEILTKIITDCGLATEKERANLLEAVITEIKGKMKPPTDNTKDNKIAELEAQVNKLQTPQSLKEIKVSEAVKKEIMEISKEFGLTSQQLVSASSYQELATLQSQAFKGKLSSEISDKKSAEYLNIGLGVLCMGSLMVLAWMLIKQNKGLKIGDNEEDE
ncbi:MAG: hypothetical protein MRERV_21c040 [Mycoplasmataceae bacterium RV_VA103A]|nr:MAG: hypothetical protein MRERV_21c040 [Mycoplasmataceae bacterium RV_VA103A]